MSSKRIIIAGGGRVGFRTAWELADRRDEIAPTEKDPARAAEVADEYLAMVIEGDATVPSILEQAEPERADAVAALTDQPGTNLATCIEAKQHNPNVRTLARTDTGTEDGYDDVAEVLDLFRG